MKRGWKRLLALTLSALIMLPSVALAADAGDEQKEKDGVTVAIPVGKAFTVEPTEESTFIPSGGKRDFKITLNEGRRLDYVTFTVKGALPAQQEEVKLDSTQLEGTAKGTAKGVSIKMDAWPERSRSFILTVSADNTVAGQFEADISCQSTNQEYNMRIHEETGNARVNGGNENGKVSRGKNISLSVVPEDGYRLSSLIVQYGTIKETLTAGNSDWNGLHVTWNAKGESTVSGELYDNLDVEAVVEKIPIVYKLTVDVDDGLERDRPSSRVTSVGQGETCEVRVSTRPGYIISDCTVAYGKSYASWASGQTFLTMGNDRVQVHEKAGKVWFLLPEMYVDTVVTFSTSYDENNIPIETDEGTRINIDTNCGKTVARGDDVKFYVSTTSGRYSVQKITLTVGDSSGSANPSDGEIRVGRKNYEIEDVGGGEYVVYVDNVTEPVKLSATSSGSSSVSRPYLTINSSSHMKITKSVSSSRIDAGDDVTFYFTPDTNYQIDEITVKMGDNSRTVGAKKTSIRVGSTTYQMSRNSNGVVSVYLTDIDQNVTVSGRAYYSKDPVTSTNTIRLNTSSGSAFINGYSDGTFRPENFMTRAEAVVMLYRMCTVNSENNYSTSVFSDVPLGMWCTQEVNAFARAGIIDQTTYFYPDQYITRGELTEMLYRLSGSPSVGSSVTRFSDVSGTSNSSAIRYATSAGWINGYPDGTFRPYAYIARSEVATMMTRGLNRSSGGGGISYKDVPYTYWAYRYIQLASSYV